MENQVLVPSATEFTVGSVLSRTMSTLLKNPALFIGLAFIALIPGVILTIILPMTQASNAITNIVDNILALVIEGAIAYGVFQVLRGQPASIGSAFSNGMNRVGTLIGLAIATGLLIGIGMVLFIVPGVILMCIWAVVIPVCVVEKKGLGECMSRSAELTKGYRLKIFGLFLLVGIVIFVLAIIVVAIATAISAGSVIVMAILMLIVLLIPQAFNNVMIAIIYYDLRAVKEGVSVDALANVFD